MRLIALALSLAVACAPAGRLVGTELEPVPAPDFTLTDGRTAEALTLSSLRGKAVVLTFLYTRCPDTCPLTAANLRRVQEELGPDADRVALVAVSVDPAGDTPQAVREFSARHRLDRNWHYLIGGRPQLEVVWVKYGIGSTPGPASPLVAHTDALFLIDPQGRERSLLRTDDGAEAILNDLRLLLAER